MFAAVPPQRCDCDRLGKLAGLGAAVSLPITLEHTGDLVYWTVERQSLWLVVDRRCCKDSCQQHLMSRL